MAVMAKHSLDYLTLFFISAAVLLLAAIPVGGGENPSTPAPTVQECRGHIENALKEFIVHKGPEDISPVDAAGGASSPEDAAGDLSKESHSDEDGKSGSSESKESHEDKSGEKEGKSSESDESGEDKVKSDDTKESDSKSSEGEKDDSSSEDATKGGKSDSSSEEDATEGGKSDSSSEEDATKGGKSDSSSEEDATKGGKSDSSSSSSSSEEDEAKEGKDDSSSSEEDGKEGKDDSSSSEEDGKEGKDDSSSEEGDSKDDKSDSKSDESSEEVTVGGAAAGKDDDSKSSEESGEGSKDTDESKSDEDSKGGDKSKSEDDSKESREHKDGSSEEGVKGKDSSEEDKSGDKSDESDEKDKKDSKETDESSEEKESGKAGSGESDESKEGESKESGEDESEEEEREPVELRSRTHVDHILGLDDESMASTIAAERPVQITLKELKKMYESAVKPMEVLYKFKDISNRFVGDAEIFSKPMILFIGPWSSGKSSIINYLLDIEDTPAALKTGAEPQSNGFTVLMYGETEQTMDGIEIAADWTFSSLQKFGQSFLDRLQGLRLPNNLLRKVTIVDTPGIIENRKQQERTYPFNDACQWLIDRADIIYVVFDPTKLDMGLEIEALFDQLKGRESQARILLNKADAVNPQELMKVQSTLLWNLSPLLGSSEPPTIFVGNFRSHQFLPGSPTTLFKAQEVALLEDLRQTIDGRVENKISFTRRHAVRVRNHAKMVDCYLNTYYNHKTFFSNKKKIADEIVDNPQNYHIYEGLSTLTNISRYDLPDPDIYRDFFKVNPLYDFKLLASTCSYFKGCPLDKLDLAIAYELPELMGKYRKTVGSGMEGGKR